mmetsp:Transcript_36500/g.46493  ORF Transcript_36500/g.46493 Transcript_36500/m.46493 type:complete len:274 (-) Transcript_36500:267-1088(-)
MKKRLLATLSDDYQQESNDLQRFNKKQKSINPSFSKCLHNSNLEISLQNSDIPHLTQRFPEIPIELDFTSLLLSLEKSVNSRHRTRSDLIKWLRKTCDSMKFSDETFYLAVNVFDRFCETDSVPTKDIVAIASVSLLISSKFIEGETSLMKSLSSIGFSHSDMIFKEREILIKLDFELMVPTVYKSLEYLSQYLKVSPFVRALSLKFVYQFTVNMPIILHGGTLELAAVILMHSCCILQEYSTFQRIEKQISESQYEDILRLHGYLLPWMKLS